MKGEKITGPEATILICTHNGERTIRASVESVLSQKTKIPFEVVVVDDGSEDGTNEIAREMGETDNRVKFGRLSENSGLWFACNMGIKQSRGEYLMRLDDDDHLHPDALESLCRPLRDGHADWAYSDRGEMDVRTGTIRHVCTGPPGNPLNFSRLAACGVMMRRDLVRKAGGYRDIFWEEYDLLLRYETKAMLPIHYVPRPLYITTGRTHGSRQSPEMKKGWRQMVEAWGEDKLRAHGFGRFL